MKALLVYPKYPDTFWSFTHALKIAAEKAAFPPLGLLTVAAMLPASWEKRLVDMNVSPLKNADIEWADYVFISAMVVQKASAQDVIARCRQHNRKTVAGGPLFTSRQEMFGGVDHLVLGEAEITLPVFLDDLANGRARHVYVSDQRPTLSQTPTPLWSLIRMKDYSRMSLQYSRGCPFNCEFCDIVVLNGRRPRTKDKAQVLSELESIYQHGWRGPVFIVDDNFIGNKEKLKSDILPAIVGWAKARRYPFQFSTEASINLADDDYLLQLMIEAGFSAVFVGIESTSEASLSECNKLQNKGRDLIASVKKIQRSGMEVQGGFILGFDNDPPSIFQDQASFIQRSGIVTAMVGLLNVPRGTQLYHRLRKENRIIEDSTGDNTDASLNFVPKMDPQTLVDGYRQVVATIYSPRDYYQRIRTFLAEFRPARAGVVKVRGRHVWPFARSIWLLGVKERGRLQYWRFMISTLAQHPRSFPLCMTLAVYGFHFRKVFGV